MRVGVLALQSAAQAHIEAFSRLGIRAVAVRRPEVLAELTHLVLPGGESTTLAHLLAMFAMDVQIVARHQAGKLRLMGTCAGAILLGREERAGPRRLGLLDVTVERNAYGRQLQSERRAVYLSSAPGRRSAFYNEIEGVFIRAPRMRAAGPSINVLAREGQDLLAVEAPGLLATTFHPELALDGSLHARFLADRGPFPVPLRMSASADSALYSAPPAD